jgi:predicted membrane protein
MKTHKGEASPRTILGVVLIVLAVLLFLNNIGFTLFGAVFSHWPLALIATGGFLIYSARSKGASGRKIGVLPYALIAVGVLAALTRYGVLRFGIGALVAPLALLICGLYLFKPRRCPHTPHKKPADTPNISIALHDKEDDTAPHGHGHATIDLDNRIDIFTILSAGHYNTRSQELVNGNIVCILGGAEVDIREADTRQEVIQLDILAFMGGVELKIPPNWQVTVKLFPFLGGINNRTTCLAEKMGMPKRHLVITGLACMGGLEIHN